MVMLMVCLSVHRQDTLKQLSELKFSSIQQDNDGITTFLSKHFSSDDDEKQRPMVCQGWKSEKN